MMAPGFKPVGWVAAVAGSAIVCYMLSLNVASERADLLRIEREIVETKQTIRGLQTELGTRGRLAQLEQWNAEVLALSAPTTAQFLENEVKLARFDRTEPTLDERAEIRLASADGAPAAKKIEAPVVQASAPVAPAVPAVPTVVKKPTNPLLRQASLTVPPSKLAASNPLAVSQRLTKPVEAASARRATAKPAKPSSTEAKPLRTANASAVALKQGKPGSPVQLLPATFAKPPSVEKSPAKTPKPAAQAKSESRIDSRLAQQIAAAAKLESGNKAR